jgi:hypothetical protein
MEEEEEEGKAIDDASRRAVSLLSSPSAKVSCRKLRMRDGTVPLVASIWKLSVSSWCLILLGWGKTWLEAWTLWSVRVAGGFVRVKQMLVKQLAGSKQSRVVSVLESWFGRKVWRSSRQVRGVRSWGAFRCSRQVKAWSWEASNAISPSLKSENTTKSMFDMERRAGESGVEIGVERRIVEGVFQKQDLPNVRAIFGAILA